MPDRKPRRDPSEPYVTPYCLVIDQQEGLPYTFEGFRTDVREGGRPLSVRTETRHLKTGDYSLAGLEAHTAVERKTLTDLYRTVGQERERFVRELQRLAEMQLAAVVVEATWHAIVAEPPRHSKLPGKVMMRNILAWMARFPSIHWVPCSNRRLAEVTTFRLLERYWRDHRNAQEGQPPGVG